MADAEDLVDYDEEVAADTQIKSTSAKTGDVRKGSHVGLHSSSFQDFLLKPELNRAIVDCGFEHPSEVQHECIPQAILGMDIICQAKSGMGKSAVFIISTLQLINVNPEDDPAILCVVMCHTRELAFQLKNEYLRFMKYMQGMSVEVFYGGVKIEKHRELLKKSPPVIAIGTPGRLLQLAVDEKVMKLDKVKHFVMDECDNLLEKTDMRRDVQRIFMQAPHDKQTMMFSATLSQEIRPICRKFTHDPLEIYVDDEAKLTLHGLQQYYVRLAEEEKNRKLMNLLDNLEFNQVIIFCNKVRRAIALQKLLLEGNFPAVVTHSQLKQDDRIERLDKFKKFEHRILVTTDLFGRGIDIERVNVSISYDMAESADQHLHRSNRSGRFGTKGLAICFVSSPADEEVLKQVQSRFEVEIPPLPDHVDPSTYMNA